MIIIDITGSQGLLLLRSCMGIDTLALLSIIIVITAITIMPVVV